MTGITGRDAALKALSAFRRDGTLPDKDTGLPRDGSGKNARETALATQLFKGVLQNMAYCDYVISCYSSIDLKKIHPQILDVLRISVYQIIFLDSIPRSAAVNEGVSMARKHSNPRAAGFVNAVLRKAADAASYGSLPEVANGDRLRYLAVKYSHPEWLVREFCDRLGADGGELLLIANNSAQTPLSAQINTLSANTATVLSSLAADGVDATGHEWLDGCLLLRKPGLIERLDAFVKGFIYIQDIASRLAVAAADPEPGDFVIDGCAAPGGKSFAAAIMMNDIGIVLACDNNTSRLGMIKDSVARLGIRSVSVSERDALEQDARLVEKADVVLADVPCSGFGTIRRKPDIRYKSQQDTANLPDLQRKILFNLSTYVKPGGTLLYSTCTVLRRENEDVVDAFLREYTEFSPALFNISGIGKVPGGMLTLWPHIHGTDGFFICKMKRSNAAQGVVP